MLGYDVQDLASDPGGYPLAGEGVILGHSLSSLPLRVFFVYSWSHTLSREGEILSLRVFSVSHVPGVVLGMCCSGWAMWLLKTLNSIPDLF